MSNVPPLAPVYHFILFPVDVAIKLEGLEGNTVAGVAETGVGAAKAAFTVMDFVTAFTQPLLFVTE